MEWQVSSLGFPVRTLSVTVYCIILSVSRGCVAFYISLFSESHQGFVSLGKPILYSVIIWKSKFMFQSIALWHVAVRSGHPQLHMLILGALEESTGIPCKIPMLLLVSVLCTGVRGSHVSPPGYWLIEGVRQK